MGTKNYPHLHQIAQTFSINETFRIIPKKFQHRPLGIGFGNSRFGAPNDQYNILYASAKLVTAVRETIVRDEFDRKVARTIKLRTIRRFSVVSIGSKRDLFLIDLRSGRASNMGIPLEVLHGEDYTSGGAFALEVYIEMPEIDGFLYSSRIDEHACFAIFDRAVSSKLVSMDVMDLFNHDEFHSVVKEIRIEVTSNG